MARPRGFDEGRVVDAAMETFWRNGYEATSTRELSQRTGLGPSSLYNTFGGKQQLYVRALHRYCETATARQVEVLQQPGPVRARLRALMLQAIDADLAPDEPRGCFAVNSAVEVAAFDPEIRDEVRHNFARVEDELCAVLTLGQGTGEIRSDRSARALARQVQSTYYGLRVLAQASDDRDAFLETVEITLAGL
ncbi:TetR/AcrR family transcriptional regulator [Streptomyces zagrosensis]|uniref:TetR/AcrR family transcriptional repressor of nem operon n=1 Tax=Streptomyces zagrosensis TaxID=1042984 RepID=A0A7W9UXI3_9ACTN|nr:TetR/AcrR family transcriptional regulator [Streptomyces zagrosensis]MBB5934667.1 TetR/AcrR family transcriptional repressor of nem operon [Streptomyces zagrosensis]